MSTRKRVGRSGKAKDKSPLTEAEQILLAQSLSVSSQNLIDFRNILLTNGPDEVRPPWYHKEWSDILLFEKGNFAVEGFRESLPLDTLIPTAKGFKKMADMKRGDIVFDYLGKKTMVNYVSPVFNNLQCYEISFDDGTSQVCSEEHLWRVNDKKKRKVRDVSTKEIFEGYAGWDHKNGYKERRFRIPVCGSVEYDHKALKVDPYILGFWLGDGTRNSAQFTIGERDTAELSRIFESKGYVLKKCKSDPRGIHYSTLGLLVKLRAIGVLKRKHIPSVYLNGSKKQRLDLLSGLIDSDGEVAKKGTKAGTVSFTNTNKQLAYEALELVRSLGWKATILRKESWFDGKRYQDHYSISFKPDVLISRLTFKKNNIRLKDQRSCWKTIKEVKKVLPVLSQCIGVDNSTGTYLITKDYVVTHNSGKGQIVLRSFPLHCLRFPTEFNDYVVLIKQNGDLSSAKLLEIEDEYLSNPLLCSNLVKVRKKTTSIFSVDVTDKKGKIINVRIEAYGKGSSIRGLANLDRRPRIVLLDDIQDTEDARSDKIMHDDWQWFLSDVKFLGEKTRIFLIGNNLGEKCIVERVFSLAEELGFQTMKTAALNSEGKATWTEKFPVEFIEREKESYRRVGQIDIWMRERMCEASSEETRTFNKDDFIRYSALYTDTIIKDTNIFITIDPASSTRDTACFRAMCVNAVTDDNRWIIVDFPYGRWESDEFIDKLFETVELWTPRLSNRRRIPVGIEKGHFKQILEPFIYREMQRRNVFFDIVPIEHMKVGNKLDRVKMLAPRFKARTIMFPESATWLAELEAELMGVTKDGFKSLFQDLIDALAMQQQIAKPPLKKDLQKQGQTSQVTGFNPLTTNLDGNNQGIPSGQYNPLTARF